MGAALQYLSLVPGDVAPDIAVLRDRIHRSGAPDVYAAPEPMFPFIAEDVPVDPSAAQQAAQQYSQQQAAFSSQPAQTGGSVMGQGPQGNPSSRPWRGNSSQQSSFSFLRVLLQRSWGSFQYAPRQRPCGMWRGRPVASTA